jgi:hypothetical protein
LRIVDRVLARELVVSYDAPSQGRDRGLSDEVSRARTQTQFGCVGLKIAVC